MNILKLTGPSLPRPLRKRTLWTTAVILSLALALSPPQTSFAKNTPVQSPAEIGISSNGGGGFGDVDGVSDGGPGAGDVERITAVFGKGKSKNPTASVYYGGKSADGGGATGVTYYKWTLFGPYQTVFELLKVNLFLNWNVTSTLTPSDYEN